MEATCTSSSTSAGTAAPARDLENWPASTLLHDHFCIECGANVVEEWADRHASSYWCPNCKRYACVRVVSADIAESPVIVMLDAKQ